MNDAMHTVYLNGEVIHTGTLEECLSLYESPATELHTPSDSCAVRDADDMTIAKAIIDGEGRHVEVTSYA